MLGHSVMSTLCAFMEYTPIKFLENTVCFHTHTHTHKHTHEILFLHVGFEKSKLLCSDRVYGQGHMTRNAGDL